MMRPALILIIGLPEAGKTEVSTIMADLLGWQRGSCSDFIYKLYSVAHGVDEDFARRRPKNVIRQQLIDIGDAVCDVYPEFLAMGAYKSGVQVLDGVRRKAELDALKEAVSNHLITFWVKRPLYAHPKDNTSVTELDADYVIFNNGSLEALRETVTRTLTHLKLI
jgi:hypothetical protein